MFKKIAASFVLLAASVVPAMAQGTTTTTSTFDYGQMFNSANVTSNLTEIGGYIAVAAVAFAGLNYGYKWIRRVIR